MSECWPWHGIIVATAMRTFSPACNIAMTSKATCEFSLEANACKRAIFLLQLYTEGNPERCPNMRGMIGPFDSDLNAG
eukprot:2994038-Amphidinium_carterae.1